MMSAMSDSPAFTPLDDAAVAALERICGAERVLRAPEKLEPYTHDEHTSARGTPEAAVLAASIDEVAAVLRLANERHIAITPRGLGTGLVGGSVPAFGGVVLSVEKMARIIEIDGDNLSVVVEPGMVTGALQKAVEAEGLFYPVDPASLESCSIGGNVANNAGGPRAFKYGVTRHYVTGLCGVLGSGERFRWGGKVVKNASGYDLSQAVIGTEGTVAVATEITLRLLPLPPVVADLLLPFDDLFAAGRYVTALLRDLRIMPAALELVDGDCVRAAQVALERPVPHSDAAAHVIVELDGNDADAVWRSVEAAGEKAQSMGAREVLVADNPREREKLWEARRKVRDAIIASCPCRAGQDIVVPRGRLPGFLVAAREIAARSRMQATGFGHAGDGNLHFYLLGRGWEPKEFAKASPAVQIELMKKVLEMGGAISGEHGIGSVRRDHLRLATGAVELAWMRRLKAAADPNGILNPGKIF
jgi:glycolate oxidase